MNSLARTFVQLSVIVNLSFCLAQRRIVNGSSVSIQDSLYQVLVMIEGKPSCGGALISKSFVLSAAHFEL
jgi:hypothetical protein